MLWVCNRCGCKYAVGLPYCPQCTSTDHRPEGEQMPKISATGPSNADLNPPAPEPAAAEPEPAEAEAAANGYEGWTVEMLRDELRGRSLAVSGAKAELVERLRTDDQAHDDAPADAEAAEGA